MLAWYGGISVDLREATLAPGRAATLGALFGGIASSSRRAGASCSTRSALAGGVQDDVPEPDDPDAPTLTIEGTAPSAGSSMQGRRPSRPRADVRRVDPLRRLAPGAGRANVAALVGGTVHETAQLVLPRLVRRSRLYEATAKNLLRIAVELVGGVERPPEEIAGEFERSPKKLAIRKGAGNVVELGSIFAFGFSPLWLLAAAADVTRGTRVYLDTLVDELKDAGVIAREARAPRRSTSSWRRSKARAGRPRV